VHACTKLFDSRKILQDEDGQSKEEKAESERRMDKGVYYRHL
jgi:hypothetical protein